MALLFTIIFMSKSLAIDHSNSSHLHSRALKQYLCNLLCKQSPRLSNHLCQQHWHLGLYWGLVQQFHTKSSDIERRPQNFKRISQLVFKILICGSCHLDTAPNVEMFFYFFVYSLIKNEFLCNNEITHSFLNLEGAAKRVRQHQKNTTSKIIQYSTQILTINALSKWHDPHSS